MTDAMWAGTVAIKGHEGAELEAYLARPLSDVPRGGVVVIHHLPGYDAATKEITRRFAANGYAAVMPNLYSREGAGVDPDDQAAAVRARGGLPDGQVLGDVAGAAEYLGSLEHANGKIGLIGFCAGGRQAVLSACSIRVDAVVDCYGAFVYDDAPESFVLNVTSLASMLPDLSCPVLGLFGEDDRFPPQEEVAALDAELTRLGKEHEFHSYAGAGHALFATDRPAYRPEAAVDGWKKIFDFYGRHLSS
jgi:dienelactone hydrolase